MNLLRLILLIFGLLLFIIFKCPAQALPRKAWFGAQLEAYTDSKTTGLKVLKVVGGTSVALKVKEGDIILEANSTKLTTYENFASLIKNKVAGDNLDLRILREGKTSLLKGQFVGRATETDDNASVIYDQAPYKGGQLSVIINKPNLPNKMPAMLFVPGYTCSSMDNLEAFHPYKRIIDAYVDAGYVTLRIEKSGLGDSKNTPECESCNLTDEIENFEQGLLKLKSLPYVDTSKIIIFGHSMGGIVAPALSAKHSVAGVVVYGTTAKSWFEYQLELNRVQTGLSHLTPLEVEQSVRDQYELNYRYFIQKERLEDMAKHPLTDSLLRTQWQYDGNGRIFSRNAEYWRQIQDLPLLANWKDTRAQVLALFGEADFQAFSRADHEQIVNTVNYYHPGHASLKTFPGTDHYFAKSGTMQEAFDKFANGQYMDLFNSYNQDVGKSAVEWSNTVIAQPNATKPNGSSWVKLKTEAYPGKQDDITFINENEGWYINGYGAIYHTQDAGSTWTKQFEKKGTFFRCVAFIDSLRGFVGTVGTDYFPNVTDTIPLYQTQDGGKTWSAVNYSGPYVKGLCAIDIVKEQFINHGKIDYKHHLYAVGRVGSPANMMVSHDDGKTWTAQSLNDKCKMLFDIKMFDKNEGIACAASNENIELSNALILHTSDGGKTWNKVYQSNRPFETTWKVAFPSRNIGYVTIQSYNPDVNIKQQRIAKTTDGGKTWTELNLVEDNTAREFGIGFIDDLHGFVGTTTSGYETTDGGKTWQKIDLGKACNKIRIYTSNKKVYGYAIGVNVFKL